MIIFGFVCRWSTNEMKIQLITSGAAKLHINKPWRLTQETLRAKIETAISDVIGDDQRVDLAYTCTQANDPAKTAITGVSELGLVEMTRQRRPLLLVPNKVPASRIIGTVFTLSRLTVLTNGSGLEDCHKSNRLFRATILFNEKVLTFKMHQGGTPCTMNIIT